MVWDFRHHQMMAWLKWRWRIHIITALQIQSPLMVLRAICRHFALRRYPDLTSVNWLIKEHGAGAISRACRGLALAPGPLVLADRLQGLKIVGCEQGPLWLLAPVCLCPFGCFFSLVSVVVLYGISSLCWFLFDYRQASLCTYILVRVLSRWSIMWTVLLCITSAHWLDLLFAWLLLLNRIKRLSEFDCGFLFISYLFVHFIIISLFHFILYF